MRAAVEEKVATVGVVSTPKPTQLYQTCPSTCQAYSSSDHNECIDADLCLHVHGLPLNHSHDYDSRQPSHSSQHQKRVVEEIPPIATRRTRDKIVARLGTVSPPKPDLLRKHLQAHHDTTLEHSNSISMADRNPTHQGFSSAQSSSQSKGDPPITMRTTSHTN